MKKISVVITIIILAAALAACSNVPAHKNLGTSAPWKDYERVEYVTTIKENGVERKGTMTQITTRVNGKTEETIGKYKINGVIGSTVETSMVWENGDTVETKVLFTTNIVSRAAYRKSVIAGEEIVLNAEYVDEEYRYETVTTAVGKSPVTNTGSIGVGEYDKSPYFDNMAIFSVMRSLGLPQKNKTITYSVPSWENKKLLSITSSQAADTAELTLSTAANKIFAAHTVVTSLNQEFSGQPITAYFSIGDISDFGIPSGVHVLLKAIEGNTTYEVKSYSETQPGA